MHVTSAVLAILIAMACAAVAIFGSWREGAAPEAAGVSLILLSGAIIALFTHQLRYLAAAWGVFLGVWLIAVELLVLLPMRSKGVVMQEKILTLSVVIAVTVVALAGLVLALLAPARG